MDKEKKHQAMNLLRWQANYINWEKGLQPKTLLKEVSDPDPDFEKAFENLKINKGKVLDIGCGWGYLSLQITQKGNDVTGIDISEKAIQYAKKMLKSKG